MKGKNLFKRLTASLLALLMIFSAMPSFERIKAVDIDPTEHISDTATIDAWKTFFGDDTHNAGAVWSDKSVFAQSASFDGKTITLDDEDNFLISLSAIASNKSIKGYSYRPTDTVLVLDISGSMFSGITSANAARNSRAAKMVEAANKAIKSLLDLNEHNRVGVIFYSGDVNSFLLPLDSYSASDDVYLTFEYQAPQNNNNNRPGSNDPNYTAYINTGDNLKDGDGNPVSMSTQVVGGTYIQSGLYEALNQFKSVTDTEIPAGEFQAGTVRLPITVLMSDGAPTFATTYFANVGTSNVGNGGSTSANDVTAFLTQLTAVYVKNSIEDHYDTDSYFYTLGIGTSSDSVATSVLNPASSSRTVVNYWNTYNSARQNMSITTGSGRNQREYTIHKNALVTAADRVYVDKPYSANSTDDITTAFVNIVNQIIIQSRYYPTNIESGDANLTGDISFKDELGLYMEVKDMKGILVGNVLYSGEAVAKSINNQTLGTKDSPTDLGNEFVRSVMSRVGVDKTTAQSLIREAWLSGQLYYNSDADYSNYIGWYADANGKFVGFWDGKSLTAPANYPNAVYANKSYGYLGETGTGATASDMMYTSVQVHTKIASGQTAVIFKVPAAIIPVISYDVQLDGDSYESSTTAQVTKTTAYPIRLVYEVGLRSDINEITVADKVGTEYIRYNPATGAYSFYTNRWDTQPHIHGNHLPDEHINTVSYFTPAEENERYYYIEDTLIYTDKNGTLYDGSAHPANDANATYYRAYYAFSNANGIETVYEEIHRNNADTDKSTIHKAVKNADGQWVIPLGTIHRYDYNSIYVKANNETGTYGYSVDPTVGHYTDPETNEETYFSTRFLGNNGKLTIVPAQGIKLSKTVEGVLPEGEHVFEFEITNTTNASDNSSYEFIHYTADGIESEGEIKFTNGKATATLESGETMYIIGLEEGETFEVEEIVPTGSYYYLKSINGSTVLDKATITVERFVISDAEFVNTYIGAGHLVVSKTVTHDLGDDYEIPENISFEINVNVGTELAGLEYDTIIQHANGTVADDGSVTVNTNGIITLNIKGGDVVLIQGIPTGTEYTVTETDIAGFVPSIEGATGAISGEENSYVYVTNDYQPDPADTTELAHVGTKTIDGREWLDTDAFTFILEKFDGSNFVEIERATVTSADVDAATKLATFSFSDTLQKEVFDEVGIYQYRIREIAEDIGGITYSTAVYNVIVTVGDNEMDGKLDILGVTTSRIADPRGQLSVETPFINTYSAEGGTSVTLNIQKLIEDINGAGVNNVSLEGYKFQVYDANGNPVGEELTTDANGKIVYERTYTSDAIGQTYDYVIKEVGGNAQGIIYSTEEYAFSVSIVDNLDGTVGAVIYKTGSESDETSYDVSFTNTYNPKGEIVLEGTKVFLSSVDGVGLIDHAFRFEVKENGVVVATGYNEGTVNGTAALQAPILFEAIEYTIDDVGTHTYTITEVKGDYEGITYDTNEITVVVEVIDDGSGVLKAEVVNAQSEAIEFTNSYEPDPTDLIIVIENAVKTLIGRDMIEDEFVFNVYPFDDATGKYDMTNRVSTGTNAEANAGEEALITFSPIAVSTNEPTTLKYLVVEEKGTAGGINYSLQQFEVEVVIANNVSGECFVESITHSIDFENTYTPEGDEVVITGIKYIDGRDLNDGEFAFELKDEHGIVLDTKANAENGTFAFAPIEYTLEDAGKTFIYTVNEVSGTLGGVIYDNSVKTVKVQVVDNGNGQIIATVTNDSDTVSFLNEYDYAPAEITVTAKKTIVGRDMTAGEFTFELLDPNGVQIATATNTAGTESDLSFTFTAHESGTYTVREIAGTVGGITYSNVVYYIDVTVDDNGDGTANASYTVRGGSEIVFTNTYEATGSLTLSGTKTLVGRDMNENDVFEFVVKEGDTVVANGINNATAITFDTINYTLEDVGTHTYVVSEVLGHRTGVTYDTATTYTVTVEVSDNGDGTLNVSATGADAIAFVNTYDANGSLIIEATKTITGKNIDEETFTFELKDADQNVLQTKTNVGGNIVFDAIDYVLGDVGETFVYTVSEVDEGKAGYTYDDTVYTVTVKVTDGGHGELIINAEGADNILFTNYYGATSGKLEFEGTKTITGDRTELTEDDVYEFIIKDENDVTVDTAFNDENGVIAFEIPLSATGDFKFYISEVKGDDDTITYDEDTIVIDVTVSDNGSGTLVGTITSNTEVAFENKYTKPEVTVTVNGTKSLEGRAMIAGEFGFIVTDDQGNAETVYNNAQGAISFSRTYYAPGTYVYTVVEDDSKNELGMTYDQRVYTVTVTVNNDFTYDVETTLNGTASQLVFENSYTYIDPDAYVTITGTKVLSGRELAAGEFSFRIVGTDGTDKTVTNSLSGAINFGTFTYKNEGTFTYTISEVSGSDRKIVYDDTVYVVTVDVDADAQGKLSATVSYAYEDGTTAGGVIFSNEYKGGSTPSAPIEAYVELVVKKEIVDNTGDGYKLDGFIFLLTNTTTGETYTAVSNEAGYATFGIVFKPQEVGMEYIYKLVEVDTEISGMKYDETVHEFKINVGFIPTINKVSTYLTKDGELVRSNLIATFTNTYDGIENITPPDVPEIDPVETAFEEEEAIALKPGKKDLFVLAYGC